jgi:1,4-alpha-glucan branching enzyme
VVVISNFTPVPRTDLQLGVPAGVARWREALNTDSGYYGGANLGNGGRALVAQALPCHGRAQSIRLTVPPLATLFLLPD